jgi:hypothetical protein
MGMRMVVVMGNHSRGSRQPNHNFKTLLDFSLGHTDDRNTTDALGIDTDEALFLLMAQAHLPMPRLHSTDTLLMAHELGTLLKQKTITPPIPPDTGEQT